MTTTALHALPVNQPTPRRVAAKTPTTAEPAQQAAGIGDASYHDHWYGQRTWTYYRPIVSHLVRHGRPGPLLDLGGGVGLLAECASRFGFAVTALEASHWAVKAALTRCPNLQMVQGSLDELLPFKNETFETVVLNQVIEHLGQHTAHRTLQQCLRVLRPGGMLYVASPCRHHRNACRADPTHQHCFTPSELRQAMAHAGFENIAGMDAPRRGVRWLWEISGRPDRLSATATARGYKAA